MKYDVIVIGGGAAGMMAALFAARNGASVALIEKNEKLGKKVYITGKGRCNVTNTADDEEFMRNIVHNSRFLYASFACLDNFGLMELLESFGLKLKEERGGRVFPLSDHASDVTNTLQRELEHLGVTIRLNTEVQSLVVENGYAEGVQTDQGAVYGEKVILATGGLSYPSTGSTGDGHRFAADTGHRVTDTRPSLVPIDTVEKWPEHLTGLSLKNVVLTAVNGKGKKIYSEMGEMLFTHFGISGPLVLSLSGYLPEEMHGIRMFIDLKPALDEKTLDDRILRDFAAAPNKYIGNIMDGLEPHTLGLEILAAAHIPFYKKVNSVTQEERKRVVQMLKALPLTVDRVRDFNEAIITRGGVDIRDINPSTMESKIVGNLYFCGELIDVDALTGGFNLQIAFSTGALAGQSAAEI